jgi:hypothetical protein
VDALRSAAASDRPARPPEGDAVLSWAQTTRQLLNLLLERRHAQWEEPWKPA